MNKIENWACKYIEAIDSSFADLDDAQKVGENLFVSGRLDSMALMTLLLEAEEKFNYKFTAENFQDRRIQTISGLSELITELIDNK